MIPYVQIAQNACKPVTSQCFSHPKPNADPQPTQRPRRLRDAPERVAVTPSPPGLWTHFRSFALKRRGRRIQMDRLESNFPSDSGARLTLLLWFQVTQCSPERRRAAWTCARVSQLCCTSTKDSNFRFSKATLDSCRVVEANQITVTTFIKIISLLSYLRLVEYVVPHLGDGGWCNGLFLKVLKDIRDFQAKVLTQKNNQNRSTSVGGTVDGVRFFEFLEPCHLGLWTW